MITFLTCNFECHLLNKIYLHIIVEILTNLNIIFIYIYRWRQYFISFVVTNSLQTLLP
jgi:hypothetical protein